MFITLHKIQVQVDKRSQHKSQHTEPDRWNNPEHIVTGDNLMNGIPIGTKEQELRLTINEFEKL